MGLLLVECHGLRVSVHFIEEKLVAVSLVPEDVEAQASRFRTRAYRISLDQVEELVKALRNNLRLDDNGERLCVKGGYVLVRAENSHAESCTH